MSSYLSERKNMINFGKRQYNNLGASLDPLLPTFAVGPSDIDNNTNLTIPQYLQQFNNLTDVANVDIVKALGNPDITPMDSSPTNMGPNPFSVKAQLPPPNDILIKARQCESDVRTRDSCSKLKDPNYSSCGICIDGGTKFNGDESGTFIGGLLSLKADRNVAIDNANGGAPIYQPSVGKCPPGMFFVNADACQKAVNQLNCKEIGDSGGFQGGRTKEGRQIPAVSCAQAPVPDVYLYQPPNKPYNVTLRFQTPFGTGITKAIVTHVATGKTFVGDNGGNAGQEFTVTLRGVKEQDKVNVLIAQEQPHRPKGKNEVFQVITKNNNGSISSVDQARGSSICQRIGTQLANNTQLGNANAAGLQSGLCGVYTGEKSSVYSVQSGKRGFGTVGSNPAYTFCPPDMEAKGVATWCYGFKPTKSINDTYIPTTIVPFFESFGSAATPEQDPSTYSQYSTSDSNDPPGISQRAVLIQWEMPGTQNRTVAFQPTIVSAGPTASNMYSLKTSPSAVIIKGPFANSLSIRGPAWNSNMAMQKNQFWIWGGVSRSQTVVFSALVPGYLQNPYYSDDLQNAPMGPLIADPATAELLKTSPCFADGQNPGAYSSACLLTLFQGAGGDPQKGTLATKNGGLSQLNSYGDLSTIDEYLNELFVTATTGKDGNGNVISLDMNTRIAAMNDAAMKLFGFEITNPCEDLVDNADGSVGLVPKPMSSVSASCLQYLWLNNLSDKDRGNKAPTGAMYSNTYTSIADRFSGLRYSESTPDRRNQYPFQACQTTGTLAPIKNGTPDKKVIGQLTSMGSLQAIQDYFNGVQKTANYGTDPKAQAVAMTQCYGINQAKSDAKGYGCGRVTEGLALWFDGADPLGNGLPPSSGTPITTLADKSGKGYNAKAQRGGGSFVSGGGIGLGGGYYTLNAPYSQTNTIFLVATGYNNNIIGGGAYYWNFNSTNFGSVVINSDAGWESPLSLYDNQNGIMGQFVKGTTLESPFLVSILQVPGKGIIGNYNGNMVISKSSYQAGSASAITVLGAALANGNSALEGGQIIYELILYNRALSGTEIQQVEGQLACKWKLQSKLPSSHPYKSSCPQWKRIYIHQ